MWREQAAVSALASRDGSQECTFAHLAPGRQSCRSVRATSTQSSISQLAPMTKAHAEFASSIADGCGQMSEEGGAV